MESPSLHPQLFEKCRENIKTNLQERGLSIRHFLFFGPCGVGKYYQTQAFLALFSPSGLKYQKKILITVNKQPLLFKMSDVHYEIDMALLGCNPKIVFHDFFMHVVDSIQSYISGGRRHLPYFFILCKNFHDIHSELLDIFDSYMHEQDQVPHFLRFILISEHISFLSRNILEGCEIVALSRPSHERLAACFPHFSDKIGEHSHEIKNVAELAHPHLFTVDRGGGVPFFVTDHLNYMSQRIYEALIELSTSQETEPPFLPIRDLLYDLFVYQTNITDCVAYLVKRFLLLPVFAEKEDARTHLFLHVYRFFHYYNNNYRPIYHLEHLVFQILLLLRNS